MSPHFVTLKEWTNFRYKPIEWEFLFSEFKFKDEKFFTTFIGWDSHIQSIGWDDRKCSVCLEYYSVDNKPKKFVNCSHSVCNTCYRKIHPRADKFRCCVICRESEKPNVPTAENDSNGEM